MARRPKVQRGFLWGVPLRHPELIENDRYVLVWYGLTFSRRWSVGLLRQVMRKSE
jgi:hypothetical protein